MSVAETLEAGAELIERNGWWQGGSGGGVETEMEGIEVCAVLSLNGDWSLEAEHALRAHLGLETMADTYAWNDAPGQTKENVCRTLREVAAKLTPNFAGVLDGPERFQVDYAAFAEDDPNWHQRAYEPV